MKINNRINTVITGARMNRIAKTRALTSRYKSGNVGGSGTAGNNNGVVSKGNSQLLQFLQQLSQNSGANSAQNAQKQSKIYDYGIIEVSAGRVEGHMDKLLAEGASSLYKDGEAARKALEQEISSFVDDYNITVRKLSGMKDSVSEICGQKLKSELSMKEAALRQLGITVNSDGTLACDLKTLKQAELSDIKKVFGEEKGLSYRIKTLMQNVGKNATEQERILKKEIYNSSSNYNRKGADTNNYRTTGNSYNAKG